MRFLADDFEVNSLNNQLMKHRTRIRAKKKKNWKREVLRHRNEATCAVDVEQRQQSYKQKNEKKRMAKKRTMTKKGARKCGREER